MDDDKELQRVEALMALMGKYEIDELEGVGLRLKKSRHRPPPMQVPDDVGLAQHLAPLPNEPWNSIPQDAVDKWAEKGSP